MNLKKSLLSLLLAFAFVSVSAQMEDHNWFFGQNWAIHFNNGAPQVLNGSQMWAIEASTSVSDAQGNLLFYTDGETVWNANHVPMPNGSNLMSSITPTQIIAIPNPANASQHYLFHYHCAITNCAPPPELHYSMIDMSLNGGLGDVVQGQKNIPVFTGSFTEGLAAVKHGSSDDWWIVFHEMQGYEFYTFPVTAAGIGAVMTQTIGDSASNFSGELEASPDGTRLAVVDPHARITVCDFDRCTGLLSNPLILTKPHALPDSAYYGCAFSPNSDLLYVGAWLTGRILQYDLSAANVAASEDTAYHVPNVFGIGQMQLGPDGKIYFGIVNQGLGVIQNPNVPGPGCNATTSPLVVGNVLGLPSFPNYRMEPIICGDPQALDPNVRLETKLYPNPFSNRAWLEVDHDGMFPHALVLYDLNGKLLQSWPAQTEPRFEIERGDLPPGLYLYQVLRDRQIVATGKLQIE